MSPNDPSTSYDSQLQLEQQQQLYAGAKPHAGPRRGPGNSSRAAPAQLHSRPRKGSGPRQAKMAVGGGKVMYDSAGTYAKFKGGGGEGESAEAGGLAT